MLISSFTDLIYRQWPSSDPTWPADQNLSKLDLDIFKISTTVKIVPYIAHKVFSRIWPSDLLFDPTWPISKFDLDTIKIYILVIFQEDRLKTVGPTSFISVLSKIWPSDLLLNVTLPIFTTDLGISMTNILTIFYKDRTETVPYSVYNNVSKIDLVT